jgi:hypothetical protein
MGEKKGKIEIPEGWVSSTEYAKKLGCSRQQLDRHFRDGKLTEGATFKKIGRQIYVNPIEADRELALTISSKTKNNSKKELPAPMLMPTKDSAIAEEIAQMSPQEVLAAQERATLELQRIAIAKSNGSLVDMRLVNKLLYEKGEEIKLALESQVDRVVLAMRAASTDREATDYFKEEQRKLLDKVSAAIARPFIYHDTPES